MEKVEESLIQSSEDEGEQVADSLYEPPSPLPEDPMDPVTKETEEVINKQGLSPRCLMLKTKKKEKKNGLQGSQKPINKGKHVTSSSNISHD